MPIRRTALWGVALLLLTAVLWTGWWFYVSRTAMIATRDWVEEQRSAGFDVHFGRISSGGYPLTVTLTVERFGIAGPGRGWRASVDAMAISFPAWRFDRYDLESLSPVRLGFAGIPDSLRNPIEVSRLTGRYSVGDEIGPHAISLLAEDAVGPVGFAAREVGVTLTYPTMPPVDPVAPILNGRLEVVAADLPGLLPLALSSRLEAAVVDLRVSGPLPTTGSALKKAELWRDAGGIVDVTEFALAWQSLNLRGDGTVALDAAMRPLAAFSLRAVGLKETASSLEQAGVIGRSARRAIDLGADLMALTGSPGDGVPVAVSIQEGVLSIGPVAVADVPSLVPGYAPAQPTPRHRLPAEDDFIAPPPPPTVSEETLRVGPSPEAPPSPVPSQ